MDVAASEFWVPEKKCYDLDFKVYYLFINFKINDLPLKKKNIFN